jgi:hypothetical protein
LFSYQLREKIKHEREEYSIGSLQISEPHILDALRLLVRPRGPREKKVTRVQDKAAKKQKRSSKVELRKKKGLRIERISSGIRSHAEAPPHECLATTLLLSGGLSAVEILRSARCCERDKKPTTKQTARTGLEISGQGSRRARPTPREKRSSCRRPPMPARDQRRQRGAVELHYRTAREKK